MVYDANYRHSFSHYCTVEGIVMTEIVIENVSKRIGGQLVLQDIDLKIKSGDVAVILGPAGSGKTMLLKIIAGTEKPDKGRVYFDGKDVTDLPPQKRDVGMVFQNFALYPNMTIYDNIASPLRVKKISEREIQSRVNEIVSFLNIGTIVNKKPHECSGGEAQRAAIARALVKRAKVYLFDQPLTNLDYKVRESLRFELQRVFAELNTTVLYCTPNPEEAAALGKTLVYLRKGRVVQQGSVKECFAKPVDLNAANAYSIVGVNVFDSKCVRHDDRKIMAINECFQIDVTDLAELDEGKNYKVAFYPHDVALFPVATERMLSIPVSVELIENMGSEQVVVTKCGDRFFTILASAVDNIHQLAAINRVYIPLSRVMIFSEEGLYVRNV